MKILLISAAVFLTIFSLILLARVIFSFLLDRAYQRYKALKNSKSQKKYKKEEEEVFRKREIPRAHSAVKAEKKNLHKGENYEVMQSQEPNDLSQVEIVDFVKPIGFWTSMILGQKLTYLIQSAQTLNKRGNKGFWVSMIEAKDRAAGRQHGR